MGKPVIAFFLLAFGITWGTGALALAFRSLGLVGPTFGRFDPVANLLLFMALWGPAFASLLMSYNERGWRGMAELLSRLFTPATNWRWWAAAILVPLGLQVAALLIAHELAGTSLSRFGPRDWTTAAYFFVFGFLFSPLGEEIGWRGYALPHLMKQMSPLTASILMGVIWIAWHAPAFVVPALERSIFPPGVTYLVFACMAMPVSVLMSWVYVNGGNLFLPVIFHFFVLFQATSIQKSAPPVLVWTSVTLFTAAALLVIISGGWTMTRKSRFQEVMEGVESR